MVTLKWKSEKPFRREIKGNGFSAVLHLKKDEEIRIEDSIWPELKQKLSDSLFTGDLEETVIVEDG